MKNICNMIEKSVHCFMIRKKRYLIRKKGVRTSLLIAVFLVPFASSACSTSYKRVDPFSVSRHPAHEKLHEYSDTRQLEKTKSQRNDSSLWNSGPDSLFGDRRARRTGDIVTVVVEIDEEAEIQNSVNTRRDSEENFSVSSLFGANNVASRILPAGSSLDPGVDLQRSSSQNGQGNISRQERITLRVAAIVKEILPNGHMIIEGTQKIKVNDETRNLLVAGIVRTEDISRQNTVTYDKIAEARVQYGGRGQVSDSVSRRWGSRLLNRIIPF